MGEGSSKVRGNQDLGEGKQNMELVYPSPSAFIIKWLQKRKGHAQANYCTPIHHRWWEPIRLTHVSPCPFGRNVNQGWMMVQTNMLLAMAPNILLLLLLFSCLPYLQSIFIFVDTWITVIYLAWACSHLDTFFDMPPNITRASKRIIAGKDLIILMPNFDIIGSSQEWKERKQGHSGSLHPCSI